MRIYAWSRHVFVAPDNDCRRRRRPKASRVVCGVPGRPRPCMYACSALESDGGAGDRCVQGQVWGARPRGGQTFVPRAPAGTLFNVRFPEFEDAGCPAHVAPAPRPALSIGRRRAVLRRLKSQRPRPLSSSSPGARPSPSRRRVSSAAPRPWPWCRRPSNSSSISSSVRPLVSGTVCREGWRKGGKALKKNCGPPSLHNACVNPRPIDCLKAANYRSARARVV